eukprot:CAMPEP_0179891126 /NCGR_PEP_ID=MMETSP0982-20121206/33505_1 /TAXON_ID=483367 /ORGANISM="non described non described, Strain CCMP 2436" /LENGTH=182 /DNA_ID=CAMNT_0021787467 /DNA_START=22 /DNA_END=570 /DNA_ORIENTATION=-
MCSCPVALAARRDTSAPREAHAASRAPPTRQAALTPPSEGIAAARKQVAGQQQLDCARARPRREERVRAPVEELACVPSDHGIGSADTTSPAQTSVAPVRRNARASPIGEGASALSSLAVHVGPARQQPGHALGGQELKVVQLGCPSARDVEEGLTAGHRLEIRAEHDVVRWRVGAQQLQGL